jgi:CRP-like cAMP-binding protein
MTKLWSNLFGYKHDRKPAELPTINLLSRVPLFEDLSRRELAAVEHILHRREYMQDEVIFRQDELGMGMYIVFQGKVGIFSEPDHRELFVVTDGDFFGEVALLDESPRSATAIAKTNSIVFGFFQPDLFQLISQQPRLGMKVVLRVASHVGQRLRQANERVFALTAEVAALKKAEPRPED